MTTPKRLSLGLAIALATLLGGTAHGQTSKVVADTQRQATRLVSMFRTAKKDAAKRAKVVEEAVASGPNCVTAVQDAIERELQPQMARYSQHFFQQAQAAAKKKISGVDPQEVTKLRQTVFAMQARMDFTPELIKRDGIAPLKKLEELLLVDRARVIEESEALQAERKQLEEPGKLWERCAQFLHEQSNDENKPKDPPTFEQYVRGQEALQAGLAAPMDAHNRQVFAANARLEAKLDPEEYRAIQALNVIRNLLGLNALAIDPGLCSAARDHSQDMETHKFDGHESPVPGRRTPFDRARRYGTTCVSENLCKGTRDGKAAIEAWFGSPGHHRSLVEKTYTRVGVGLAGQRFTQLFGL